MSRAEKSAAATKIAAIRANRVSEGLKRYEGWAHPQDIPAIKAKAASLAKTRARKVKAKKEPE